MQLPEKDYLGAIRHGRREDLEELYQVMLPKVYRNIRFTGGTQDDARDLVQDAIMALFQKQRREEIVLSNGFTPYFLGVCRNIWGNRMQKKSVAMVTISEDPKYRDIDSEEDWHALEEELARNRLFYTSFARLGALCRQLLQLFIDGRPMAEIMAIMGHGSYDYTRRRKYLCKQKLIEIMKSSDAFEELARNPNHGRPEDD